MLEREHIVAHYMPSQAAYSAHVAVLPARCAGADLSRAVHGTFLRILKFLLHKGGVIGLRLPCQTLVVSSKASKLLCMCT